MDTARFSCPACTTPWVYVLLTRQEKCRHCLAVLVFDPPADGVVEWETSDVCGPSIKPARGRIVLGAAGGLQPVFP